MACTTPPPQGAASLPVVIPRVMTRCECAGVPFHEVARRMREEGLSLDEVCARTGCGRTCTACLPDLRRFLASL